MIPAYLMLAGRIRNELQDLEQVIDRAERALAAAQKRQEDQDFYIDSVALNLHDFYSGLEKIFQQIAANIEQHMPSGKDWHRELLEQMNTPFEELRPAVLSPETINALDEFLRFRHVVRNVYTFSLEISQVSRLVKLARPAFEQAKNDLSGFVIFLEQVGK
jgi:hypothetical protein